MAKNREFDKDILLEERAKAIKMLEFEVCKYSFSKML